MCPNKKLTCIQDMSLFSEHKTIGGKYTHQSAKYLFLFTFDCYGKVALKIHMCTVSHMKGML